MMACDQMRSCSSGGRDVNCGKVVGVLSSLWKVGIVGAVGLL